MNNSPENLPTPNSHSNHKDNHTPSQPITDFFQQTPTRRQFLKIITNTAKYGSLLGLLGGGNIGYQVGSQSYRYHINTKNPLARLPEKIEPNDCEIIPGLLLKKTGLTMNFSLNPTKTLLKTNEALLINTSNYTNNQKLNIIIKPTEIDKNGFVSTIHHQSDPHFLSFRHDFHSMYHSNDRFLEFPLHFFFQSDRNTRELATKYFLEQPIYYLEQKDNFDTKPLVIASDHNINCCPEKAQPIIKKIYSTCATINNFILQLRQNDPFSNPCTIKQCLLFCPDQQEKTNNDFDFHAEIDNGNIIGLNTFFSEEQLLLAVITHEAIHFLPRALRDWQKENLVKAFQTFQSLAKQSIIPANHATNEIYQLLTESQVFAQKYPTTGHPYDNPEEMLSSLVACLKYGTQLCLKKIIQISKPNKRDTFLKKVIKPCLDIFGDDWGPKIIGSGYKIFRQLIDKTV